MKKLLLVFIAISIVLTAQAEITEPENINHIKMQFTESADIVVEPQASSVSEITLKLYAIPQSAWNAEVLNIETSPEAELKSDEQGDYYEFKWIGAKAGTYSYSLSADIDLYAGLIPVKSEIKYPYGQISVETIKYVQPSGQIDSGNPALQQAAHEIVGSETDVFEVAYKLADYVHNNIEYDKNYLGKVELASNILKDKKGVCAEYATLFAALGRSIGLPVRYISGYAYGNIYGAEFFPHAWTEVYFPNVGWVPFDPTFGQYGWLDATHIKTQESESPQAPTAILKWYGQGVSSEVPELSADVEKIEYDVPKFLESNMRLERNEVAPGSYNIVWLEVINTQDFYVAPKVHLAKSPKIIGENQKIILVKPFGDETVGWPIQVSDDVQAEYSYEYTIQDTLLNGWPKEIKLLVNPQSEIKLDEAYVVDKLSFKEKTKSGVAPVISTAVHAPEKAKLGDSYTLRIMVENTGDVPENNLQICASGTKVECRYVLLGVGEQKEVEFVFNTLKLGVDKIELTFTSSGSAPATQIVEVVVEKKTFADVFTQIFKNLKIFK